MAAKCGENTLRRWNAIPDPELGAHVYRLAAPGLSIGIVDIESLPYNNDTLLLKMLGKAESAKLAFSDILKLDPNLELRQDIIEVSIKHCIYLEQFRAQLTTGELDFMTYVQEVEETYQRWVKQRRAEGIREGTIRAACKMVRNKFGIDASNPGAGANPSLSVRISQLSESQLDEFTAKIFEWQQPNEMIAWLEDSARFVKSKG
ncbi:hypothetical protein [Merismopedia glauca]|uniref:DUF4351 domain-containing protein n=1 Tax=Merismopedia glauca CCAP 1448/3 TaxID=1296344 RepID=A0A2T1C115_9CYAN|nr:hypothetical protein [Merismopedia glauca]PSB01857.1 hypothetical protein C7B64_16125 [Merismopedia glauca CCAP 1448/3]